MDSIGIDLAFAEDLGTGCCAGVMNCGPSSPPKASDPSAQDAKVPADIGEAESVLVSKLLESKIVLPFEVFNRSFVRTQFDSLPNCMKHSLYAYAASMTFPPAPVHVARKYYSNARKELTECIDGRSYDSIRCFLLTGLAAASLGDPFALEMIMNMAKRMATYLIDPKNGEMPEDVRKIWHVCLYMDNLSSIALGQPRCLPHDEVSVFMSAIHASSDAEDPIILSTWFSEILHRYHLCDTLPMSTENDFWAHHTELESVAIDLKLIRGFLSPSVDLHDVERTTAHLLQTTRAEPEPRWEPIQHMLRYYGAECLLHRSRARLHRVAADLLSPLCSSILTESAVACDRAARSIHSIVRTVMAGVDRVRGMDPVSGMAAYQAAMYFVERMRGEWSVTARERMRGMVQDLLGFLREVMQLWRMMPAWHKAVTKALDEVEAEEPRLQLLQ
ncbi:hypothetical protein HDU96_005534 [Phlyctochytrium bullatum]|nr:hypothetical protein HDU96_005534 [Phlyctochytrium bullatum]